MKRILCICMCAIGLLVVLACETNIPKEAVPETVAVRQPATTAEVEAAVPDLMERGMIPGLSIAVIRDGKIAWEQGFGVKRLDTSDLVTLDTIFEAASLSKPMFSYAVMRMVDRG